MAAAAMSLCLSAEQDLARMYDDVARESAGGSTSVGVPVRIAFRNAKSVGARNEVIFAAQ